jgi:outer membrane lipoprotein-sorting protein
MLKAFQASGWALTRPDACLFVRRTNSSAGFRLFSSTLAHRISHVAVIVALLRIRSRTDFEGHVMTHVSRLAKPSLLIASAAFLLTFPAGLAAQPTAAVPAVRAKLDPATEKILDRLEARGREIKDIETNLVFIKRDPIFESTERFEGVLLFKEDQPNPRFLIRFDRSTQGGRAIDKKEWHVFDGRFYIEARERTRTIVKHEVLRPGEKREVFRLGQGPFPLPFGQKKEDILRHFSVKLVPPAPKDPPETDHLELTPLPDTEMDKKYEKVHFYIDRRQALPVRVQTVEKEDGKEIIAAFSNLKLNTGLPGSRLVLPTLPDYSITEDLLPSEEKAPAKRSE